MPSTALRIRALDLFVVGLACALSGCVLDWDAPRPYQPVDDAALPDRALQQDAPAELPRPDLEEDSHLPFDLPFDLPIVEAGPADAGPPGSCGNPHLLPLNSVGATTVSGKTSGAVNDFGSLISCASTFTFDGPQRYYLVPFTGGQRYALTLYTPGWDGALYLFKTRSCDPVKISNECVGNVAENAGYGDTEVLIFTPKASGSFTVVVDSKQKLAAGSFTLTIMEAPLLAHTSCAKAKQLNPAGGKDSVTENTYFADDEHATLQCQEAGTGLNSFNLSGRQLYYRWAAKKDSWYKLTLKSEGWWQHLYTFSSSACSLAAIAADCRSTGPNVPGATQALYYKAKSSSQAYFAVDSASSSNGGAFTASLVAITAPKNATCANAQLLPLLAGNVSVSSDVGPLLTPNEFTGVQCGTWTSTQDGPQVYYSVDLKAGQLYFVSLTADSAYKLLAYRFSDTCDPAVIKQDCNLGKRGDHITSDFVSWGSVRHMAFTPVKTGRQKIAVDSRLGSHYGGFTLDVEELAKPANDSCKTAEVLTLNAGLASVSAVKAGATNTLAACGSEQLDAIDLWYKFTPTPGKKHRVTFKPGGPGHFVVFDGNHNCVENAVKTDCLSKWSFIDPGMAKSRSILGGNTPIYIVVDGTSDLYDLYRFSFVVEEL
jgi:hypothetical protein